jgi:hypothetical protein
MLGTNGQLKRFKSPWWVPFYMDTSHLFIMQYLNAKPEIAFPTLFQPKTDTDWYISPSYCRNCWIVGSSEPRGWTKNGYINSCGEITSILIFVRFNTLLNVVFGIVDISMRLKVLNHNNTEYIAFAWNQSSTTHIIEFYWIPLSYKEYGSK